MTTKKPPQRKYDPKTDYEKKLGNVMARLGVTKYDYDWSRKASYIEMLYGGCVYRFDNSFEKAQASGRRIEFIEDLFAEIVRALEGLALAVEKQIFTLDMLLAGVPSLPAHVDLPNCVINLGLDHLPETRDEITRQYYTISKTVHPDIGGSSEQFVKIKDAYEMCLKLIK